MAIPQIPVAIIAIDPGPVQSGWVIVTADSAIVAAGVDLNRVIRNKLFADRRLMGGRCIIEDSRIFPGHHIATDDLAETFRQQGAFRDRFGESVTYLIHRSTVCKHFGVPRKNSDVSLWRCLIERYGPTEAMAIGGNKCRTCKGKKWRGREHAVCTECEGSGWLHEPGPLHGIKSHARQALAVGITYLDGLGS